jgi:hypothetical protein
MTMASYDNAFSFGISPIRGPPPERKRRDILGHTFLVVLLAALISALAISASAWYWQYQEGGNKYQDGVTGYTAWRDGNWSTFNEVNNTNNNTYSYVNYTIPSTVNTATWQHKYSYITGGSEVNYTVNRTIPQHDLTYCFQKPNPIQIRGYFMNVTPGGYSIQWACWDYMMTTWSASDMVTDAGANSLRIYEEAIWWNVSDPVTSITSPMFSPSPVYRLNNLTASVNYTGETGNITFYWYVGEVSTFNQSIVGAANGIIYNSTLANANYTINNAINVTTNAISPNGTLVSYSSLINISNHLPTIASAFISPDPAVDADNLTCNNGSIADLDSDTLAFNYTWYKNSAIQSATGQVLNNALTSVGDQWYCIINITDGYEWSGPATSQTVIINSALTAPTLNYTNATTAATQLSSTTSHPTNNNSYVNLSVTFADANAGELHTAYFCKTNSFSGMSCIGGQLCNSSVNTSDYPTLTCTYSVGLETAHTINYYAYVVDNTSLTQGSGSGLAGSFVVNHPPGIPAVLTPGNVTWTNLDYTIFTFSGSDPDGDSFNFTLFLGNTTSPPLGRAYNGAVGSYNATGLNETTYFWRVIANDTYGYASDGYSVTWQRKVDLTAPILVNISVAPSAFYTDELTVISADCYDPLSGFSQVGFNVTDAVGQNATYTPSYVSGNRYSSLYAPLGTPGHYNITAFWCQDLAGNRAIDGSGHGFDTTIRSTGAPIGGGGGGAFPGGNLTILNVTFNIMPKPPIDQYFLTLPTAKNVQVRYFTVHTDRLIKSCLVSAPGASCKVYNDTSAILGLAFDINSETELFPVKTTWIRLTSVQDQVSDFTYKVIAINLGGYVPSKDLAWLPTGLKTNSLFALDAGGKIKGVRYTTFLLAAAILGAVVWLIIWFLKLTPSRHQIRNAMR